MAMMIICSSPIFAQEAEEGCQRSGSGFVLRDSISQDRPDFCQKNGANGATLTYSHDHVTDETAIRFDGAIGYSRAWFAPDGEGLRGFTIYTEGEGTIGGNVDNKGRLDFGVSYHTSPFLGAGGVVNLSFSAFALTDVNFEADGYGLSLSAKPFFPDIRLNVEPVNGRLTWTLSGEIDALFVGEAGVTGLQSDTEYAWMTVDLGAVYTIPDEVIPGNARIELDHTYSVDLFTGEDRSQTTASFGVALTDDDTVRLNLTYTAGETRNDPEYVETTQLVWTLKF